MTKIRTTGAIVALALLASGCSGIGDGSKLETIRIAQDLSLEAGEETSVKAFTCLASPLVLVGTFSKGDVGDFAFRAKWTSDDESVVKVANRGDPVEGRPGEVFLRGGVLLAQPTTVERTTTVHAEYLGLTSSMQVVVKPTENLRIIPAVSRVIPASASKYTVRAKLDGVDTDVTGLSELFFVEPEAETDLIATVGEEAQLQIVRGVAPGGPLTLKAKFDATCDIAPTAEVRVQNIPDNGLVLAYEEGFGPQIAERTAELLRLRVVFGDFNDDTDTEDEGEFQRLDGFDSQTNTLYGYDRDGDGQCELLLEDPGTTADPNPPTALTFGSLLSGLNTMVALSDEDTDNRSTTICASFGPKSDPDGDGPLTVTNGFLSNVLPLEIVDAPLTAGSIVLAASDPCKPEVTDCEPLDPAPDPVAPEIDEGTILLIKAQGTFEGGYTQDITKNVIFTSDKSRLVAVGAGGVLATASDISVLDTDVCPTPTTACSATVTATWNAGTSETTDDVTKTMLVTVKAVPDEEETP